MIGTLNLIFSSVLLLCGMCLGASLLMQFVFMAIAPKIQETAEKQQQTLRQQQIDIFKAQENAAATDAEKARIAARRQLFEQQKTPTVPINEMADVWANRTVNGFWLTDFCSGLFVNILLFASGIGLLAAKSWGRKLAVWVAVLKLIRLLALYGVAIVVVVPEGSKLFADLAAKSAAQQRQQQPQPPGQPATPKLDQAFVAVYSIAGTVFAVSMIVFGSIYPAIMLWVLTRPKVKLACGEQVGVDPADMT
jgi:ABC-type transport system involved in cytochrome bd biosynthesis fused ATPase/permease subunit